MKMKSEKDNMRDAEMTCYAFISHMEDYMKQLLNNPLKADTDIFLHSFGIDGPSALKMLVTKTNPNDDYSAVVIRSERIKGNGYDENGKRNKDTFEVKYKIPRKDFKKKLRNLYVNLFEKNIIKDCPIGKENLDEGAWGYGILDNDSALDLQTEFAKTCIKVLCSKLESQYNGTFVNNENLWSNIGVLSDFLKKYKDNEIQLTSEYTKAINIVQNGINYLMSNKEFINSWSEPEKIKSSLKKTYKDISLLQYQDDIMNGSSENSKQIRPNSPQGTINEDGEGAMSGVAGATTADSSGQYTTPLFGKPIKRKTLYITKEQAEFIKESSSTCNTGDYQNDVSFANDNDFYKDALDHKNIIKNSQEK